MGNDGGCAAVNRENAIPGNAEKRDFDRFVYPLDRCPRLRIRKKIYDVVNISQVGIGFSFDHRGALNDFTVGEHVVAKLKLLSGKTLSVSGITIWEKDGSLGLQLTEVIDGRIIEKERKLASKKSFLLRLMGRS